MTQKNIVQNIFLLIILSVVLNKANAQEKVFANYFDLPVSSVEGTEVVGRIHLERNKDVRKSPIPAVYHFEILEQDASLFRVETQYDLAKRLMGVFVVDNKQNTGKGEREYNLKVVLKDENKILNTFPVTLNIVKKHCGKRFTNAIRM